MSNDVFSSYRCDPHPLGQREILEIKGIYVLSKKDYYLTGTYVIWLQYEYQTLLSKKYHEKIYNS